MPYECEKKFLFADEILEYLTSISLFMMMFHFTGNTLKHFTYKEGIFMMDSTDYCYYS